jgi:hypothetical protein
VVGAWSNHSMGYADAFIFAILALADMAFMVHLRRRRARRVKARRIARSLRLVVQGELGGGRMAMPRRVMILRRAS